ncbi:DUF3152 domain-containing protein [Streptomyces sp. NBC_01443]|uniref:DUF3152 domain-containing protein n=1 Tax=Streptomyces sp. NBC_01443 TaxID=2903868 RepID=UPI0022503EDD|nr:DUF3152 domain-containing protein [Streptomyces sp. NBC_01443]MCX4627727.1 DUF3152 domain-containing protein [Streptomyces sp. NBC_01443]
MGRHSRKGPAPAPAPVRPTPAAEPAAEFPYGEQVPYGEQPPYAEHAPYAEYHPPYQEQAPYQEYREYQGHQEHFPYEEQFPYEEPRGGHPEPREPGGAWGAGPDTVYGDWRGVPRARRSAAAVMDGDTPAFGTPAVGFPQVTLPQPPADPFTSTGSHGLVPGPRAPMTAAAAAPPVAPAAPAGPVAPAAPADPADPADPAEEQPGSGRGRKVRTYTMAAAAVTTVLAVVVAVQVTSDGDSGSSPTARAAGDTDKRAEPGRSPASRSDGRATPAAPAAPAAPAVELSYEQKMAQQFPIDEKLKGPGTFDTVPGVAPAPGKGKKIRYRVDVEQGLGLDAQLFAEAVHRTLNDDRSWGHGGTKTFERVPGGEADFVITLASPGTTGVWCAKSDLDTTVDNVSCDSASTERVMINAFRWAQGSSTYGADQMFAYRQMLINHEVGHRLGHGHVNCQTPGSLAPIMQQQTKSLDIGGIQCKPNPWVFPGN